MTPQNNGSGSDSGSGGIVHYANGKKVQHIAVQAPPPPPQTMSATPMQQGTTPQQTAQAAQAAPPSDQANQAPSNTPSTPPSPQDAHAAMDQNAQAAHGHVQSGPQQATPPAPPAGKPKGKVPPQFAKK